MEDKAYLSYKLTTMAIDELAMQGARATVAIVMT